MNFVKTKDGSFTAYNNRFKEHYHSISGAMEEAREKYVKPLGIKDEMTILDFCFGLGYNSFAAIYNRKKLSITALENDIEILKSISEITPPPQLKEIFSIFKNIYKIKKIEDRNRNRINLIVQDAKKSIRELSSDQFDRVFFDPFSPKKIPDLWSKEVFTNIYRLLKVKGKLATYSCDQNIRKNMEFAGFTVKDGPCIGRKSPSTIALKNK